MTTPAHTRPILKKGRRNLAVENGGCIRRGQITSVEDKVVVAWKTAHDRQVQFLQDPDIAPSLRRDAHSSDDGGLEDELEEALQGDKNVNARQIVPDSEHSNSIPPRSSTPSPNAYSRTSAWFLEDSDDDDSAPTSFLPITDDDLVACLGNDSEYSLSTDTDERSLQTPTPTSEHDVDVSRGGQTETVLRRTDHGFGGPGGSFSDLPSLPNDFAAKLQMASDAGMFKLTRTERRAPRPRCNTLRPPQSTSSSTTAAASSATASVARSHMKAIPGPSTPRKSKYPVSLSASSQIPLPSTVTSGSYMNVIPGPGPQGDFIIDDFPLPPTITVRSPAKATPRPSAPRASRYPTNLALSPQAPLPSTVTPRTKPRIFNMLYRSAAAVRNGAEDDTRRAEQASSDEEGASEETARDAIQAMRYGCIKQGKTPTWLSRDVDQKQLGRL
ncbi:hypothetical protein BXZ70DRAFT_906744 [Cristinia sonorae]|uniref:Uncharacterized protein n=1 Tax=Cristinia sonorae TaxID=1940300 RepID=A0A8K0UQB1_9AGAR|nr:hypothetical protein BXZ70DRAFT_906744 [Cristinia sonorae]